MSRGSRSVPGDGSAIASTWTFGPPVKKRRVARFILVAAAIGAIASLGGAAFAQVLDNSPSPTIASDKSDYPPGATVTLTGANWASG